MTRHSWPKLIVAAALPLLTGCGSSGAVVTSAAAPAATSAGSSASAPAAQATMAPVGPTVTLRMADAEDQGRSSQPWIDRFVSAVARDSGGAITIDVLYNAGGEEAKPEEQIVAERVMSGGVELALVPVRAWNDVGVVSLQALEAPLLIDNDALLTAVARDPLVQPLLDGMRAQGLIGLSVWPDDLRHPFAWEKNGPPIVKASDFKGAKIWTLTSELQSIILEGLGATPIDAGPSVVDSMVADGSLRGAESSFGGITSLSGTPTGTGDVVLYPKYQVLVAEDSAFSRLTPQQQAIVRTAAVAARDLAIANHPNERDSGSAWCEAGGRVVLAGEANVASFQKAVQPVIDRLAQDKLTSTALDAIRALKAKTPPAPTAGACEPPVNLDGPWPSVAPGPPLKVLPDGVYVHTVTRTELLDAGVSENDARNNAGKWTLTVQGDHGTWDLLHGENVGSAKETFPLRFELMGDRVRFQQTDSPSFFDVRWRLEGDSLVLEIVNSDWNTAQAQITLNAFFRGAWTRVE